MARGKTTRKSGSKPRPDGELRASQMITAYGPGALVDLIGDAILIPGLEYWSYKGSEGYEIHEPRLAANLRRRGLRLSRVAPFRRPPVNAEEEPHRGCGIGAIEFPSWFLCPNRGCERLIHKRDTEYKSGERRHRCATAAKATKLVPVRFVTACPNGHLGDFPWVWFVHEGGKCDAPELRLVDRGSGDLSDVWIRCETCEARRPMSQARGEKALPKCRGHRPWLGAYVGDSSVQELDCDREQRLLVRTASGGYHSQVESALSIPKISKLKDEVLDFLTRYDERELDKITSVADLQAARKYIKVLADGPEFIKKLSDEELWHAISTYRSDTSTEDDTAPVRETEYVTIMAAEDQKGDHLYSSGKYGLQQDYYAVKPPRSKVQLPAGIRDLVLLERLREIRVLTGFTRLEAPAQNIYGEFDLGSRRADLSTASDWIPAAEVRGEGFFIELDLDMLEAWEARPAVRTREDKLRQGFVMRYPKHQEMGIEFQGIRFYLLHTLAHLLITQVSLDCGYAASAIRERIYCSPQGSTTAVPMAGILLSTGTTGSEGTLGGLVEQGRCIKYHLDEALRRAKLCSHDPVCARQEPTQSTPGRALLGAACHGCLFVAECSCERSNQYLDRALVVPTMGLPDAEALAFFPSPVL